MNWQGRFETCPYRLRCFGFLFGWGVWAFCLRWAEISDGLMRRAVVGEHAGQV